MNNILHNRRGWTRTLLLATGLAFAWPGLARAQSPAASGKAEEGQGIQWGRSAPGLLTDSTYLNLLQIYAPEWMKQNLAYPSDLEQAIYEGTCDYDQRIEFAAALREIFARPLPGELIDHAVVLRGWQVLYKNWDKNVGADAFVVRFSAGDIVYQISEIPSKVIVLARPLRPERVVAKDPVDFALIMAERLFKASILPPNAASVTSTQSASLAGAFEGRWPGRNTLPEASSVTDVSIAALGNGAAKPFPSGLPPVDVAAQGRPAGVDFFAQGDLCAYLIDKELFQADVPHALTRRFQSVELNLSDDEVISRLEVEMVRNPSLQDPGDRVAYYERLRRHLNIRTAEEFLGPLLFDSEGNRLAVDRLDYQLLAASIEDLNADQRQILLRQRQVDWHYIQGLKAFESGNARLAIDHWARALTRDPLNVRVALLLEIAAKDRLHREFNGSWEQARQRGDTQLASASQLLVTHNQRVVKAAIRQAEDDRLEDEVNALRIEALKLYQEGLYQASRDRWREILRLAPDDSTALLYANLMEMKMKEEAGAAEEKPAGQKGAASKPAPNKR